MALIRVIGTAELGSSDLMQTLGLSHRPTFRNNYLNPALEGGWIERTQPDSPRSPPQRYRLTGKGRAGWTMEKSHNLRTSTLEKLAEAMNLTVEQLTD